MAHDAEFLTLIESTGGRRCKSMCSPDQQIARGGVTAPLSTLIIVIRKLCQGVQTNNCKRQYVTMDHKAGA